LGSDGKGIKFNIKTYPGKVKSVVRNMARAWYERKADVTPSCLVINVTLLVVVVCFQLTVWMSNVGSTGQAFAQQQDQNEEFAPAACHWCAGGH
jgi:hypothetical protein